MNLKWIIAFAPLVLFTACAASVTNERAVEVHAPAAQATPKPPGPFDHPLDAAGQPVSRP